MRLLSLVYAAFMEADWVVFGVSLWFKILLLAMFATMFLLLEYDAQEWVIGFMAF